MLLVVECVNPLASNTTIPGVTRLNMGQKLPPCVDFNHTEFGTAHIPHHAAAGGEVVRLALPWFKRVVIQQICHYSSTGSGVVAVRCSPCTAKNTPTKIKAPP